MCRLFALTSRDPVSPMLAIKALDVMRRKAMTGPAWDCCSRTWAGRLKEVKRGPDSVGYFQ